MSDPLLIALVALGFSAIASAVRMIDWFIHGDPKTIAQTARWAATAIAALSLPVLFVLLWKEQWAAASALAAAMFLVPALAGRRVLRWLNIRPLVADRSAPVAAAHSGNGFAGNGFDGCAPDDRELVRHAATVLETYLRRMSVPARGNGTDFPAIDSRANERRRAKSNGHAGGADLETMSEAEALAILGLSAGASERQIREAHHRIAQKIHPDHGGSHYLALKVNEAKETLTAASERSRAVSSKNARKRRPSRPRPSA
jgi:DnaJ domain